MLEREKKIFDAEVYQNALTRIYRPVGSVSTQRSASNKLLTPRSNGNPFTDDPSSISNNDDSKTNRSEERKGGKRKSSGRYQRKTRRRRNPSENASDATEKESVADSRRDPQATAGFSTRARSIAPVPVVVVAIVQRLRPLMLLLPLPIPATGNLA